MKNYKIAVAGTGYVGLSLSVLLAQHNQVTAVDIVQAKVDMINNHRCPSAAGHPAQGLGLYRRCRYRLGRLQRPCTGRKERLHAGNARPRR